jgi:Fe-S cluster assembly ATP-binding protein
VIVSDLLIRDLHVSVDGKPILKGIDLEVSKGEVHALMGPNGSGKSTLSLAIMGHPRYVVDRGEVIFKGQDLLKMTPDQRARAGVFLAFQYPQAIPGVSVANFLRTAINAKRREQMGGDEKASQIPLPQFRNLVREKVKLLDIEETFIARHVNDGFSGGEKKRLEMLQLHVLRPELAILDETDSGLDIDALKTVAQSIESLRGPELGILLITHYERILRFVMPDRIHVLLDGRIVRTGAKELAGELEEKGYDWVREELYEGRA